MVRSAPRSRHFAFEPRPEAAAYLRRSFPTVEVHELALCDRAGSAPFQVVEDSPMWSGLRLQTYPERNPRIEQITVRTDRLDNVIPADLRVDLMKIDVEGAESLVLRGATRTCRRWGPLIIVEYGLAGRQQYGVSPAAFFDLVESLDLKISLLRDWLADERPLERAEFERHCDTHWYFIAHRGIS